MNREFDFLNDEKLAKVTGGALGPHRRMGESIADYITKKREEAEARIRKEEEERIRKEQERPHEMAEVDIDDGWMPALLCK